MITNIFSRSNPMNFVVIGILLLIAFSLTVLMHYTPDFSFKQNSTVFAVFPALLFSVFFVDFISKKNNLNKNDTYSILFFMLFLCLIPDFFVDSQVVISNLFVLFALRKLLSLQSLIMPKQKIFDASFWIATAAVFQGEAILFLILVFVAIIIHVSNDFKNWIIPFVGVFAVAVLVTLCDFMFDYELIASIQHKIQHIGFNSENIVVLFDSFSSTVFVILLVFLLFFQFSSIGTYLAITQNAIKKIVVFLILALLVYIISDENKKSLLLYCVAPLSIISANFINALYRKWMKEAFIMLLIAFGIISFLS